MSPRTLSWRISPKRQTTLSTFLVTGIHPSTLVPTPSPLPGHSSDHLLSLYFDLLPVPVSPSRPKTALGTYSPSPLLDSTPTGVRPTSRVVPRQGLRSTESCHRRRGSSRPTPYLLSNFPVSPRPRSLAPSPPVATSATPLLPYPILGDKLWTVD